MKKLILGTLSTLLLFASCNQEKTDVDGKDQRASMLRDIKWQERTMHNSVALMPVVADSALLAYESFVKAFPEDSLCGGFVYKSAEIQTALKRYEDALASYKRILFKYPHFHLAPESLFQQAVLLDNFLERDGDARIVYLQVVERYPNTALASDSRAAIANLGKSDAELIREFKKKNGE